MGCGCSSESGGPMNPDAVDLSHFTMLKVVGKGAFGKVSGMFLPLLPPRSRNRPSRAAARPPPRRRR